MGNCIAVRLANSAGGLPGPDDLKYPSALPVRLSSSTTILRLPVPTLSLSAVQCGMSLSSCVLPGFDPRGHVAKHCQDVAFYEVLQGGVLIGIFDGHGPFGLPVVRFCQKFVQTALKRRDWRSNPKAFLHQVTKGLDEALLKKEGEWDTRASGSTQVLVLLTDGKVYTANVGDSRLVLGTSTPFMAAEERNRDEDNNVLERVKRKRSVNIDSFVDAVQLTKDQTPDDGFERSRIMRMGGAVHKLMDESGKNVGPWRVWRKGTSSPGLAMSRSLGDSGAKEIGVTSDPVVTTFEVRAGDRFLVAASDGVWDVLDNHEVVSFIEAYRSSCVKSQTFHPSPAVASPANSGIARLLCEEARVRWLALAESEDVLIDDISCVVLEFASSNEEV